MRDRSSLGFTTYYNLVLQSNYLTGNDIYGRITWKTPEHLAAHSSSPSPSEMHDKISASNVSKCGNFSSKKERLTASIMTESGVLAVKTKPSPLAPLTSAPSSGEDAWYMIWLSSLSGTTVWHTAIIVRNSQIWGDVGWRIHRISMLGFFLIWNKLQLQKRLRDSSRCSGWESGHRTQLSYCCWTAGCWDQEK